MKGKHRIYLFYTLEFLVIAAAIVKCFGNFSLIYGGDGYCQYYVAFVYCGKYIRSLFINLLHGNFIIPQFDFAIGLGEGIISSLNYYGFGDPFMLISAVVPVKYSTYAYTAVILLKMYISGISFIFYCKRKNIEDAGILVGGAVYTASIYALYFGFQQPMYLNMMISIPLLCSGIDQVINEKKSGFRNWNINTAIVIAVAFQAVSGFYFLYMVLLFAAVYALVGLVCVIKDFMGILWKAVNLFGQILLGIMLGGIIFIPSVYGFLLSSRSGSFEWPGWKELLGVGPEGYWSVFSQVIVPSPHSGMGLVLSMAAVFAVILAVIKAKQIKEIKIVFFILLLAYLNTHMTSWVAGGFSRAIYNNRWMASLMFIIAVLVSAGVSGLSCLSVKSWVGLTGIGSLYIAGVFTIETISSHNSVDRMRLMICAVYILFSAAMPAGIFIMKRLGNKMCLLLLIGFACLGVILNIYTIYGGGDGLYGYGIKWWFKTYENARGDIQASNTQLYGVEDEFGRMDVEGNVLNESLYTGKYGMVEYLSIVNSNLLEFYKNYGIVSGMRGISDYLAGVESRNSMEDILSVVWYDDELSGEVAENMDYLPLGFTFDTYILQEDAEEMDEMTRNASVLETVIIDREIEGIKKSEAVLKNEKIMTEELFEIEYVNIEKDDNCIKVNGDSKIVLTINGSGEGEYYLYADRFQLISAGGDWLYWVPVYFGNRKCEFVTEKNPYFNGIEMGLFKLGDMKSGINTIEINFTYKAEFALENLRVYRLDTEELKRLNAIRQEETLEDLIIEPNHISGIIQTSGKKILFLSIPYSSGWTAYVNGEKAELLKADYGFMALALDEGENAISLHYTIPGAIAGAISTLVAIMILVIYYVREQYLLQYPKNDKII